MAQKMVLHRFASALPDPQVENLLYLSAGTELVQNGLSSTRSEGAADYVLLTAYASMNGATEVRYALSEYASPDSPLAELTIHVSIDQTLDDMVADAVRQLMQMAHIEAVPSSNARMEGLLFLPKEEEPPVEPRPAPTPEPALAESTPAPALAPQIPAPKARGAMFDASVSAAGVFFLGAFSEYFLFGMTGTITAGVTWPLETWRISLDGRMSFIPAFNNTGVLGGPLFIATIGPDVRFGTGPVGLFRFSADVSGGAAIIAVAPAEGLMMKTVPYVDAGAYAGIAFLDLFSAGVEARFSMIFEGAELVMNAQAALTVCMEL
jgi:hypothetical protein